MRIRLTFRPNFAPNLRQQSRRTDGSRTLAVAAVVAFGVLVAGCGSDGGNAATTASAATASAATTSPADTPSAETSETTAPSSATSDASESATGTPSGSESESASSTGAADSASPTDSAVSPSDSPSSEQAGSSSSSTAATSKTAEASTAATTARPSSAAKPTATATPPAKPAAVGQLPVSIGQWHLLTDAELRKGIAAGNGFDEALVPIGAKLTDKTPLPAQLGAFFAKTQTKILANPTGIELSGMRTFGVKSAAAFVDGSADTLLMTTSIKVTGARAAEMLALKKADFQQDSKKDNGTMSTTGRVLCEKLRDGNVRGCIVFTANGWLETEVLPRSALSPQITKDLIAGMAAVAPR